MSNPHLYPTDRLLGIIRSYYEDSMNRPSREEAVYAAHVLTHRMVDDPLIDEIVAEDQLTIL